MKYIKLFICLFIISILFFKLVSINYDFGIKRYKLYLLEEDSYDSYDMMRNNNYDDYLYFYDESYKKIIGITSDKKNIGKMILENEKDIKIVEVYINDEEYYLMQRKYDKLIEDSSNEDINLIIKNNIEEYKKGVSIITRY